MKQILKTCPTCESNQILHVKRDLIREYQGMSYTVSNLSFYECPVCNERVFDAEALHQIRASSPAYSKHRKKQLGKESTIETQVPEPVLA